MISNTPMATKFLLTLIAMLLLPPEARTSDLDISYGEVRPLDRVIKDSSNVDLVAVTSATVDSCPYPNRYGMITYKGIVKKSYRGERQNTALVFCGYPDLVIGRIYLIAFQSIGKNVGLFFSPDAVFLQRLPDQYFRLLSYESNLRTVEGVPSMILARQVDLFKNGILIKCHVCNDVNK